MNGGTLTQSEKDFYEAQYFFCNGLDDPWLHKLSYRSLVVRHASWIAKCIAEQFLMPVGPYVLDDDFDPSRIEIQLDEITSTSHVSSSDTTLISISNSNYSKTQADPSPFDAHPANPHKRSFDASRADDFSSDAKPRKVKRARIHGQEESDSESRTMIQTQIKTNKTRKGEKQLASSGEYVCLADFRRHRDKDGTHTNRGLYRSEQREHLAIEQDHTSLKLVDTCNSGPPEAFQSCSPTSNFQAQLLPKPRNLDLRALKRRNSNSQSPIKFARKPTFLAHTVHSPTAALKHNDLSMSSSLQPLLPETTRRLLPSPESDDYEAIRLTHASFWKRATRESGPLVLKISDIVKTGFNVNAKMFVPGDSCYGEQFGCVLLR